MCDKDQPSNVVELFPSYNLDGDIRCLECDHVWEGSVPEGEIDGHPCPECKVRKGVFDVLLSDADAWACECGCDLFRIVASGDGDEAMCIRCGVLHDGFNRPLK